MCIIKNSLGQSHDLIRKFVRQGDTVVDATAGNGNDTVFLAGLVGDNGKVYSFDIQEKAVFETERKLRAHQLSERVKLIHDGHQNAGGYISEKVTAVMFNLGYLPGGDHSIGTRWETTIEAVKTFMGILKTGGVISIVIYYGGDSGFEEKDHVMEFLKTIDCKQYTVMQVEFINQINCPPILVCIEKHCENKNG